MALIEAKNLEFSYNGEPALRALSFALAAGDLLAVIGPNGSGKSTLLKLLGGFLSPSGGGAMLDGRAVSSLPKAELARTVAYVPSELYLPYDFSVFELVLMGRSPYVDWWRNYSEPDSAIVHATLREVGIEQLKDRGINSLSSGERQLVFIAQALAQVPQVLMLDEPTSHLDINFKMQVFGLLARLSAEKKMSVIVVSHDISLVGAYARKVLILRKGGPVYFGTAKEGLSPANIAAAYGISDAASVARFLNVP